MTVPLPQWLGAIGTANKRACVRLRAETGGGRQCPWAVRDYLVSDLPLMIGGAAWATLGGPPYSFKGRAPSVRRTPCGVVRCS